MLTPVVFRDEAIPAHWKEILKNGGQIFRRNFAPLRGVAVRAKKSGLAVMPVDFMEGLLAIGTGLALVPIVDHVPDHATFRVGFNLREACLSAILARALIQTNVVFAERRFAGSVDNIGVHGGMVCRFGASDDALAAIAKVRAHRHGQAESHRDNHQHSNRCENSEWEYSWDLLNRLEENRDSRKEMQDRDQRGRMRKEIAGD